MYFLFWSVFSILNISLSFAAAKDTHLLLIGGGVRPPTAMALFSEWAGKDKGTVLIIGWASTIPQDYFDSISAELTAQGITHFLKALTPPTSVSEKNSFIADLDQATAVFFTGGDQNRAMDAIHHWNLDSQLKEKYRNGIAFAGTSAGTALMAETMMTGDTTPLGRGLGVFSKPIIDMHFIKRNREPRLIAAMKESRVAYGIGVDEDGAVAILNSSDAQVVGPTHVVFLHLQGQNVDRSELSNSAHFDLNHWKPSDKTIASPNIY